MRTIDTFIPPMEPFVIWGGAFTPDECDQIKAVGELCEFMKAGVGEGEPVHDEEIRDTDIVWIDPHPDNHWIFERMNQLVAKINFDKFQLDLDRFDGFQYSKYKVDGHYDWHTDVMLAPQNGLFRKLSMTVMLTAPDEYEGGEFLLNLSGNQEKAQCAKVNKGDLVCFYSNIPHKVAPVTAGERITLVTWALGSKMR